jgi:mRNA interferase MazF
VRRGEVWLAEVGRKPRPVVVMTRDAVLDVRANVTVAEVTTQARGLAVEVPIDTDTGIDRPSVVNCDGLHTVSQRRLVQRLGSLDGGALDEICGALAVALGCEREGL